MATFLGSPFKLIFERGWKYTSPGLRVTFFFLITCRIKKNKWRSRQKFVLACDLLVHENIVWLGRLFFVEPVSWFANLHLLFICLAGNKTERSATLWAYIAPLPHGYFCCKCSICLIMVSLHLFCLQTINWEEGSHQLAIGVTFFSSGICSFFLPAGKHFEIHLPTRASFIYSCHSRHVAPSIYKISKQ